MALDISAAFQMYHLKTPYRTGAKVQADRQERKEGKRVVVWDLTSNRAVMDSVRARAKYRYSGATSVLVDGISICRLLY